MLWYLRKKMKTIMIIVAVLFAGTMFYGLGVGGFREAKGSAKKGSIAAINGKEIDHKRYEQAVKKVFSEEKGRIKPGAAMFYQTASLQQIIDFTLMLNDAKKRVRVSGREVDQAIDQIMQANKIPNKDALKRALAGLGVQFSDFRDSIRDEMLVAKMAGKIKSEVSITADDLREVRARHILVMPKSADKKADMDAKIRIEEILERVNKGESFAALAVKYSDDPESAKDGGDLGFFTTGAMVPEFEKAVFLLKPGEVSGPVKTSYGYHIIKLEETRLRKIQTKGGDLNAEVLADKQDKALKRWMFDLRQKAKIEVNDPLIKAYSLYISGKLNEAISAYNEASMDNPSNPYIHLFLGDAYKAAGNMEFALLEYAKASELGSSDVGVLMGVGDVYQGLKKYDLALANYRRASLISGDDKAAHVELKSIFTKMGASIDAAKEQAEINRIEKKEKFEKEIQQQMGK